MTNPPANDRVQAYAKQTGLELTNFLGDGTDGTVWKSQTNSAIKAFEYEKNYRMELACYQRLSAMGVSNIGDLSVPRLLGFDEGLLVIEMGVVSPPCILDFGKAYVDHEPDHSEETWEEHYEQQREIWEDRFDDVQAVLWKLRQLGIYYRDASPRNIQFG